MNRDKAINELGGHASAAKWLACSPRSISNWETDEQGNLTGRRVVDAILAALVRKHAAELAAEGKVLDIEPHLLEVPNLTPLTVPLNGHAGVAEESPAA